MKKQKQKTKEGHEIAVPTKDEFLKNLKKVAKKVKPDGSKKKPPKKKSPDRPKK